MMLHLIILLKIQQGFSDTATTEVRVVRPPVVIDDNLSFTDTANDGSLLISPLDLLVNDYEFGGTSRGIGPLFSPKSQ